jgi:hypothetical protein
MVDIIISDWTTLSSGDPIPQTTCCLLRPDLSALRPANSKENMANGKMEMTLLICLVYSDTNDGRGRRYSSYGRNTFFS